MSNASAAKQLSAPKFYLKVIIGPDEGFVYKIKKPKIFIGRGDDNDLALQDSRVSRQHAMIEFTSKGILVTDLGSSTGIMLNGKNVKEGYLSPGAVLQIGDSQLKFEVRQGEAAPPALVNAAEMPTAQEPSYRNEPTSSSQGNPLVVITLLTGLGIGGVQYYKNKNQENSAEPTPIRNDVAIQEEIDAAKKRQDDMIRLQNTQGKQTQQYIESQSSFVKGFRDYREGQYKRALISLSAALALYPEHELAQRYYQASKRKLDELVQVSLLEGKRAQEKNQYKAAASAYRNVMVLIEDESNKNYQEARERYNEIQWILKGAF